MVCECVVGLAVTAAREPVADRLAGGGRLWCGAVAASKCGLALEVCGVADDQLRGGDRADARLLQQSRVKRTDQAAELGFVGAGLDLELAGAAAEVAQHREDEPLCLGCTRTSAHPLNATAEL